MRNLLTISFLLLVLTAKTQEDDKLIKDYRINIAVPDLPAFKAFNVDPSNILRPSDIKQFSVITSEFTNDKNQFVIPKSLAIEIAPGYLIPSISLAKYRNNAVTRFLANTRISLASKRSEDNTISYLSGGVRFSLINKGDFKRDDQIFRVHAFEIQMENDAKVIFLSRHSEIRPDGIDENNEEYIAIRDSLEVDYVKKHDTDYIGMNYKIGENNYKAILDEYKKKYWNAEKMEIAYAIVGNSSDSVLKTVQSSNHSLWWVWALPINVWGQFLIGTNYQYKKEMDGKFYSNISIPARLYVGTNRLKAFTELQYSYTAMIKEKSLLVNLGAEVNITDGIWVHFTAGVDNILGKGGASNFASSFNLNFTLPENFKLF